MSNTWCPLPWMHQFITTEGVKTCCASLYHEKCSPNEFTKSVVLNEIKESILNNKQHPHCNNCFTLEEQGFTSIRQESIRNWPKHSIENLPSYIEYYELRYSNLCNFSCKMCTPDFSSSISQLIKENKSIRKFYFNLIDHHNNYDMVYSNIERNLPFVKKINFAGGEPLLIKDNLKILSKLIEIGNTDCEICIITNASALNPNWLSIIKNFKTVHWTISIDGIGSTAEYIRVGTKWPQVEQNIYAILNLGNSVAFNTTLSAYSVLDLFKIIEFFVTAKSKTTSPFEQWFGLCQWPIYLRPSLLQGQYAQRARKELNKSIKLLSTITSNPDTSINELKNVVDTLESFTNKEIYQKFVEFTNKMDQLHNLSFQSTFNLENPYV